MITNEQTLYSIQALRALAFLGVLTSHTGISCFAGSGKWGVSVFLILSGFIMMYRYYKTDRIVSASLKKNVLFTYKKINRIYPLHVVTTAAMIIFIVMGDGVESIAGIVVRVVLNLLLIQEWIPIHQQSINGVSWYLCVTVFSYFVFPWVLKYMEKDYCAVKACKMIVILFGMQIMSGILGHGITIRGYEVDLDWFVYKFPPIRALDFLIGCNIGYLFMEKVLKKRIKNYTVLELITCLLIIMGNLYYIIILHKKSTGIDSTVLSDRWWAFSVIYTISSCMVVYLFAENKGMITKIFTNRVMFYLGNISQCAFLIHYVVFRYISAVCTVLFGKEFVVNYGGWIKLTIGFILTIFVVQIWKRYVEQVSIIFFKRS